MSNIGNTGNTSHEVKITEQTNRALIMQVSGKTSKIYQVVNSCFNNDICIGPSLTSSKSPSSSESDSINARFNFESDLGIFDSVLSTNSTARGVHKSRPSIHCRTVQRQVAYKSV